MQKHELFNTLKPFLLIIAILLLVGFLYLENQQLKQTIELLKNQNLLLLEIFKNIKDSQLNHPRHNEYNYSNYVIGGLILIIIVISFSSFFPGPGPGMEPVLTQIDNLGKQDSLIIDCVNDQSIQMAKGLDASFNIIIEKMDNLSIAINDLNAKILMSHLESNPPQILLGELNHIVEQSSVVSRLLS